MKNKKTAISKQEIEQFRDAMSGLKPADKDTTPQAGHKSRQTVAYQLSDHSNSVVGLEDKLFFARSGVADKVIKQLKAGKYPVRAVLDLHGMIADEARDALVVFINDCLAEDLRHVIIVHGKGFRSGTKQSVLKNCVNTWLRQIPDVLAFCSCQPKQGGTGAVTVLLAKA